MITNNTPTATKGPALEISDQMIKVCVYTSLGASGITSLLSAISHFFMGVAPIVPSIEVGQFLVEV